MGIFSKKEVIAELEKQIESLQKICEVNENTMWQHTSQISNLKEQLERANTKIAVLQAGKDTKPVDLQILELKVETLLTMFKQMVDSL